MADLRFFLKEIDPQAGTVIFPPHITHQIVHVLRLQPGDEVTVLDGQGKAYQVCLGALDPEILQAKILRVGENPIVLPLRIALFFPLSKRDKVEWILQKGTEVGVSAFYPFISDRSLVQDITLPDRKMTRWQSIIREAAEQSGRAILPDFHTPQNLSSILSAEKGSFRLDAALVAAVGAGISPLGLQLDRILKESSCHALGLFIGAEGGFSDRELDTFRNAGHPLVSLGDTVLRMETAAIVFPALVLYHSSIRNLSE